MEKKVKKIFANRYAVFQSMTNSSHLVWLLKRITLIANRKLSEDKSMVTTRMRMRAWIAMLEVHQNNKNDPPPETGVNNLWKNLLKTHNKFGIHSNIRDTTSAGK